MLLKLKKIFLLFSVFGNLLSLLGKNLGLLCLLFATELGLFIDIFLDLHGLCHPVLGAEDLGRVLDPLQPPPPLPQPVLQLRQVLVEDGESLVKVVDEDLFKPVLPGGRPEMTSKMLPAAILESTSRCELLIAACHMLCFKFSFNNQRARKPQYLTVGILRK